MEYRVQCHCGNVFSVTMLTCESEKSDVVSCSECKAILNVNSPLYSTPVVLAEGNSPIENDEKGEGALHQPDSELEKANDGLAEGQAKPDSKIVDDDLPPVAVLGIGLSTFIFGVLVLVAISLVLYRQMIGLKTEEQKNEFFYDFGVILLAYGVWGITLILTGVGILKLRFIAWLSGYAMAIIALIHSAIVIRVLLNDAHLRYFHAQGYGIVLGMAAFLFLAYAVATLFYLSSKPVFRRVQAAANNAPAGKP